MQNNSNNRDTDPVQPQQTPYRALALLAGIILLGLLPMLLQKSTQFYPNMVFNSGTLQIEFLFHGLKDQSRCLKTVNALVSTVSANCPECKVLKKTCLTSLDNELTKILDDSPLETMSARFSNGVIVYRGNADEARIACEAGAQKNRELNTAIPWTCHPAGETRPLSNIEKERAHSRYTLLTGILYSMIAGLLILLAVIVWKHRNHRAWQLNQAMTDIKSEITAPPIYPLLNKLTLAGIDLLILTGVVIAFTWPVTNDPQHWSQIDRNMVFGQIFVVLLTICWFWVLAEHYGRRRPFWDEMREIFRVLILMFIVSAATAFIGGLESGRLNLVTAGLLNLILIPVGRAAARKVMDDLGLWQIPALIIGAGKNAQDAYMALYDERGMGYQIAGFIRTPDEQESNSLQINGKHLLVFPISIIENLPDPIQIIVAVDNISGLQEQNLIRSLLSQNRNKVHIIPSLRGLPLHGTQITHFFSHEVLLLTVRNNLARRSYKIIKRTFDVVCGLFLMLVLAPLFVFLVHQIRKDGAPAFYGHTRIGKNGKQFKCLKFRSMRADADKVLKELLSTNSEAQAEWDRDFKLRNDPRVTAIGQWLRKTSLDELPQLFNVIRGEMSLVGPRPIVSEELERYGHSTDLYLQILPGMTGLWQVSGRNDTGYEERVALDAWYVQNWSLWYDVAILFKTIDVVLNRRGAY